MSNLDAALEYAALGRQVFPLHWAVDGKCSCQQAGCTSPAKHPRTEHGLSDATANEATIRAWWSEHPQANIGMVMGDGLIAIDFDPRNGGDESLRDLGELPVTVTALTGGGGCHLIYHPDEDYRNGTGIAPGVDVRSSGAYLVVPPSQHVSGRLYEWEIGCAPGDISPAALPDVIKGLMQNGRPRAPEVGESIPEGERNSTLTSVAGSMRRRGLEEAEIAATIMAVNTNRCAPPLPDHEVREIARSVSRYAPAAERVALDQSKWPAEAQGFDVHETDMGNALRLVQRHGHDLRYCYPQSSWFVWDGRRLARDDTGAVHRLAKGTVRTIYAEAAEADDDDRRKRLSSHAVRSEAEAKIIAMVSLARSESGIPVLPAQLDSDPWLFNVENGTINLHTGMLREHRQGDLITKIAPVTYDPNATCPRWLSFLNRIMDGNAALIIYIQKAIGYSLTGDVSEQALFFQHGTGANGKSTLMETVLALLGDYGKQAAPGLLTVKRGETHPTEIADLAGARFVASVEVDEGRRLAEALTKWLTGGDTVKARLMRQDFFEFAPTHKLWLSANHRPTIIGSDHAVWRRIRLIPFNVVIPESEQDRDLPAKLRMELTGILNWALAGCLEWQRDGLKPPKEVQEATAEYKDEQDAIAPFLKDRCNLGEGEKATATVLYDAYRQWCDANGEKPMPQRRFGNRLSERGLSGGHVTGSKRWWHGVSLRGKSNADEARSR